MYRLPLAMKQSKRKVVPLKSDPNAASAPLISHDLRSALADVIGGLELIEPGGITDNNRVHVDRASASAKALVRLIDELNNSLRGYRSDLATERGFFALSDFLEELQQRWSPRAAQNGLDLQVDLGSNCPEYIQLDRSGMDRILSNLIENAIKFTKEGGISLGLSVEEDRALTIVVRDTGCGFSDEALDRLFEFKGRPENSTVEGTGLGLHIAKRLVDQLSGTISVFNSASGAIVAIQFPQSAWDLAAAAVQEGARSISLKGHKVLLAEDNQTSQLLLEQIIKGLGADLTTVDDGVNALKAFEKDRFDLVFLDVEMPRMSGVEVIAKIRARDDAKAKIPLIAVSAFVMMADQNRILDVGANGIIPKPITNAETFARKLGSILSHRPDADDTFDEADAEAIQKPQLDQKTFDTLEAAVGAQAMPELLAKILDDLLSVQYRLTDALIHSDFADIRAQTHVLISVAGAVGAHRLQLQAQHLNVDANRKNSQAVQETSGSCLVSLRRVIAEIKRKNTEFSA